VRGHIRRRGSRWAVVVDIGTDPVTGKRRQRWQSGFERKRDAERALADLLAKQQRGEYVEPCRLTVRGYLTGEWLPAVQRSVRPLTWAGYERSVRIHIVPYLGELPLQHVTPGKLNALYVELLDHGRADGKGLSPGSVRQVHLALHGALAAAVRWQYLSRNAAAFADPPRGASPTMRVWTADELGRFLTAIRHHRLYPLFLVLAGTGMRRGEALGARWEDLDLQGARWQVRRTLLPVKGRTIEGTPKTARGQRSVALTALVHSAPKVGPQKQSMAQQTYLRALGTIPGLTIHLGHFLSHPVNRRLVKPSRGSSPFRNVWHTEEKGSDVNLASHLLIDGFRARYDLAVVISNDSDLKEPVHFVQYDLRAPVGILNPHPNRSWALSPPNLPLGSFYKPTRQGAVAASQFAPTLQDQNGSFQKPAGW
jgi:integrase